MAGISVFSRRKRSAAKRAADALAAEEVAAEQGRRRDQRADQQARLDATFAALLANESAVVSGAATAALMSLPLDVRVIGCDSAGLDLAVTYPGPEVVPQQEPSATPTGRPTTRKRTQTEQNELYADALASAALGAIKVAAATAPSIHHFRVLVLADDGYGDLPVLATVVRREGLTRLPDSNGASALDTVGKVWIERKGRTRKVAALRDEGAAAELVAEARARRGSSMPLNPFDAETLRLEQASLGEAFTARIKALKPDTKAKLLS